MKTEQWVTIERYKWPDRPHYRYSGQIQGEDEHGVWLVTAPQPFYRGDEVMFQGGARGGQTQWVAEHRYPGIGRNGFHCDGRSDPSPSPRRGFSSGGAGDDRLDHLVQRTESWC